MQTVRTWDNFADKGVKMSCIGNKFQQETECEPSRMPKHNLFLDAKPSLCRGYPEAQKIKLSYFEPAQAASLDRTLKQRESVRDFQTRLISKDQLSYLLWASTGIQRIEDGYEFRTIGRSSLPDRDLCGCQQCKGIRSGSLSLLSQGLSA